MTTNLENNTISRVSSLEVQDSNKKVNEVDSNSTSALVHKDGYQEKSTNLQNKHNNICPLPFSKDTAPRKPVNVSFAVDQWFRILLVHMQKQDVSLLDNSAVPFEVKSLKINI